MGLKLKDTKKIYWMKFPDCIGFFSNPAETRRLVPVVITLSYIRFNLSEMEISSYSGFCKPNGSCENYESSELSS